MEFNNIHNVYLLGIGGIGMSALAKYFKIKGCNVAGYDRTPSSITDELINIGIKIHFTEDILLIPDVFKQKQSTLIIYTPAVPSNNIEYEWFLKNDYNIKKRAVVLGEITNNKYVLAVSGTHGKTTISTCLAHIFNFAQNGCNAFLGGISKNFNSNFLFSETSKINIVEADEYDRSFLKLKPNSAIITAIDADHLDIYNNHQNVINAYKDFALNIKTGGMLLVKKESGFPTNIVKNTYTYSLKQQADCYISNLKLNNGKFIFNVITPWGTINDITPEVTGMYNVENLLAAISLSLCEGLPADVIKNAVSVFSGVKRRFDLQVASNYVTYIDDYAHHPEEIKAFINSVKGVFTDKKLTGVFQPHLYTRTRDFADKFAESLSLLDELILLDIYPARELPIKDVTSKIISDKVKLKNVTLCNKSELLTIVKSKKPELLLTMGAGDIDTLVEPLKNLLLTNYE